MLLGHPVVCPGLPAAWLVSRRSAWAIQGQATDRPTVVAAVRRTACCHRWRFLRGASVGIEGVVDPLADDIFLAADRWQWPARACAPRRAERIPAQGRPRHPRRGPAVGC